MILVTLIALLAAAGALHYATRQSALRENAERCARLERAILRAAMLNRGRITAVDVETRNVGTVSEVEDRLRSLFAQGHCDSEITSDGRHVFVFSSYDDSPLRLAAVQKQIFLHAKIHDGYVDLTRTALSTDLTYQQVRAVLEEMTDDGLCCRTDEPATYWFPSLATTQRHALTPARDETAPHTPDRPLRLASGGGEYESGD
jgi:hypothetical protein